MIFISGWFYYHRVISLGAFATTDYYYQIQVCYVFVLSGILFGVEMK
jgi:hypothetical protein